MMGTVCDAIWRWQAETFGPADTCGVVRKLVEEANEVQRAVDAGDAEAAREEVADALFMVLDVARSLDMAPDDLASAAASKLEVNKARRWDKAADGRWCHLVEDWT